MTNPPEMADAQAKSRPWRRVFRDLSREHGLEPLRIEGRIPAALRGVLYRNGPSTFAMGSEPYEHWFDGDGAITAVRIENEKAQGAVRFVNTPWFNKERRANRQLYRSYAQFGRGWRRWFTLPKNPANISVLPWGDKLLALWEAGLPIEMDPNTLETVGATNLGGRIGPTFSAHPHDNGREILNFGVHYGPTFSLDIFSLGPEVARIANHPLRFPTLIHDFVASENQIVFFCSPVRLRLMHLALGLAPFDDNLIWQPEQGTEILVVPRKAPEKAVRFEVPAFFQWHFVNAWDEGDTVVVDYLRYADWETNHWFGRAPWECQPVPPSTYSRARVNVAERKFQNEVLSAVPSEFPAISKADVTCPHAAAWMLCFEDAEARAGRAPPVLGRIDARTGAVETISFGADTFPTEPIVVPTDDGNTWVLTQVYDGRQDLTYVAILNAARPGDDAVAKLWFDHPIPFTFHGAWKAS